MVRDDDARVHAGERERDTGDWVWAPHSAEGYVPAQVVRKLRTGGVECRDEHGRTAIWAYHPSHEQAVAEMAATAHALKKAAPADEKAGKKATKPKKAGKGADVAVPDKTTISDMVTVMLQKDGGEWAEVQRTKDCQRAALRHRRGERRPAVEARWAEKGPRRALASRRGVGPM